MIDIRTKVYDISLNFERKFSNISFLQSKPHIIDIRIVFKIFQNCKEIARCSKSCQMSSVILANFFGSGEQDCFLNGMRANFQRALTDVNGHGFVTEYAGLQ